VSITRQDGARERVTDEANETKESSGEGVDEECKQLYALSLSGHGGVTGES